MAGVGADPHGEDWVERIGPLDRQHVGGLGWLAGPDELLDLLDRGCDVTDRTDPFVDVMADGIAGQADLDRPPREPLAGQAAVGIPLDTDRRTGLGVGPGFRARVLGVREVTQTGMGQSPFEPAAADLDRQDAFLAGFAGRIIQPNDGLAQVIRSRLNGGTNVPARTAASAICGAYAW